MLSEKFDQANEAANRAASQYKSAARMLGLKTFAVLVVSLAAMCAIAWFLASPLLPSYAELTLRRSQIAEMETVAAKLERRGVSLEWTDCPSGGLSRQKLCFRTDGVTFKAKDGSGRTYAVPHSAR